jgi:two-component system response regulator FlrC
MRLAYDARSLLVEADLRGNIRELRNILERAAILADGGIVRAEHIWLDTSPAPASGPASAPRSEGAPGERDRANGTLEAAERSAIERALAESQGNRRRAAERLGIGLRTLYEKLKRYGLG